ncbi:MAG: undecaprenyl-diphosphate phosphatase [Chloroflexi bacterium]|nr:undecaprenyl-diphosphate phosphatase [Chloroflexota bacterium]
MADIFKVVALSLIEGITEFLPISSTGHLVVGAAILQFDVMGAVFEVFIQFGAAVAVVAYYRQTLLSQLTSLHLEPDIRRFWLLIILALIPAAAVGFIFDEQILTLLFSPVVVASSLIVGGVAFLLVERSPRFYRSSVEGAGHLTQVTTRQAIIVGIIQILALIPGMSRSGTTIVGGMLAGMNRRIATEFSFFLAIPILGGATLYRLATSLPSMPRDGLALLLFGAALSGIVAWFTIDWLLKFVSRNSFVVFGYYRIVAGLVILAAAANGALS